MLYYYVDIDPVTMLSNNVRHINVVNRFLIDNDTWPPDKLKGFIPLLLIYYQHDQSLRAMMQGNGNIFIEQKSPKLHKHSTSHKFFDGSTKTREIKDILTPLENNHESCLILIEGAPGIGKSVLLKEIAYQWGEKHILQKFRIVLLICLRDHVFQHAKWISDLLRPFYQRDPCEAEIAIVSKYISDNGGKDLVFLFDGLDELPEKLQSESLIADIINRKVLPYCGLVVSSRPHASHCHHHQATLIVSILGFTEVEQKSYIQKALEGQSHKIEEYFKHHLIIADLCRIPFNLVVFLYLYKLGLPLPKNCAELYSTFICVTISRHLAKHKKRLEINNTELANLPEPYNKIIHQLAKLSLEALNSNKLTFSFNEIKTACPDITDIPGAINGFGLLEAVQYFGITGTTMTFNFLHFSIQEYLAAYHLTRLSTQEELKIIKETFWNDVHLNMFSMYIVLTKGQRPSFKHFLSGGNEALPISDKFLSDQLQCFHLYHCFHEAGDTNMCKTIEGSKTLSNKKIDLRHTLLTVTDIQSVAVFLASSFHEKGEELNKKWEELNLSHCFIKDHGIHTLHFYCNDLTIDNLELCNNNLTKRSSTLVSEITVKCKVKTLDINENDTIGEDPQLYSMLTNDSIMLEGLYLYHIKLSSSGAISLFNSLASNTTVKWLSINDNDVTDAACSAITTAMKKNSCLVTLGMYGNPMTGEGIENIVKSLHENNRLELIWLPRRPDFMKRISSLEGSINRKRESRGCQVKIGIGYGRF